MSSAPVPRRIDWSAVLIFLALACAWSWPLFWLRDMVPGGWNALPLPPPLRMTLLMWGPGIAALVCWRLFRHRIVRRSSVFGGQRGRALAFYFVPMLALAAVGVAMPTAQGMQQTHGLVLVIGLIGFINVLGEELGWRGFLLDALRPMNAWPRYLLMGLLWAGWHFTNLFASRETWGELLGYLAWYLPVTIALSALLGSSVLRSRAIAVAVTGHAWMNLLWEFPGGGTWAVAAASLPFWFWLLRGWPASTVAERASPVLRAELASP